MVERVCQEESPTPRDETFGCSKTMGAVAVLGENEAHGANTR